MAYTQLSRAQLTVEYLHTNSTTHEFLFGALAELVDNARDAGATRMDVYSVPNNQVFGKTILCFADNGEGMDPTDVSNVIQFGRSTKRVMDSKMIGQYGNGLKSGSMRIGKDMIMFTKKNDTMSCLFLSRTFHEREKIKEVVVPIPSWDANTKTPLNKNKRDLDKHVTELDLILKYSPFRSEQELFECFQKIEKNGTVVMIYNLKLLDSGETELEISEDDVKMRELYEEQADDKSVMMEKKSFRAYTSILYLDPRMKIHIQGKKVLTRRLGDSLYKPKSYQFSSKRFKTRSENEANKAMIEAKSAADKARELETAAKELQAENQGIDKESRARVRQAQNSALTARTEADMKTKLAEAKQKSLKEPKTLTFTFGFNINHRSSYGLFVYNCNRLIKMYEKYGFQSDNKRAYTGIVGFVDVPYLVLEPTHNKQDFADAKEYKHLLRSMSEHLGQYWKDSGILETSVDRFWDNFGYISNDCDEEPSNEVKYLRKRSMQLPFCVQCAKCLKWRTLPFSIKNIEKKIDDEWSCSLNTDPEKNKCSAPEQKSSVTVGYLQKQVKSNEEKQKEIMDDIKRKQQKLGQLNNTSTSTITNDARVTSSTSWVDDKTEERPVKRVPPRSVLPQQKETNTTITSPSVQAKPTAKLAPITRTSSSDTTIGRSLISGSNKRDHPIVEKGTPQVQAKRKRNDRLFDEESDEAMDISEDVQNNNNKQDDTNKSSKYEVGSEVDIFRNNQWFSGRVVATKPCNNGPTKVKVKFDNYQRDKHDIWLDDIDKNLKLIHEDFPFMPDTSSSPLKPAASTTITLTSPFQTTAPKTVPQKTKQAPKTTTKTTTTPKTPPQRNVTTQKTVRQDDTSLEATLGQMLRSSIAYILVPDFSINLEQIQKMTLKELQQFPLEKLFSAHTSSMAKLLKMQKTRDQELLTEGLSEKEKQIQELQRLEKNSKEKLTNLRRSAAKLIRALNEDPDESSIAWDDDTGRVDELLEAIAEQASAGDAS